ncbi:MAG: hypothetical protein ACI9KE_004203 [Polyangiales bacterium]|jgi:hypothetical protein
MLKGYVLRYLAAVATGATDSSSKLSGLGFLARSSVRKKLAAAAFETEYAGDDAHVHRLAYLKCIGSLVENANEVDAVATQFYAERKESVESSARLRFAASLLATLVLVGGAWAGVSFWRSSKQQPAPLFVGAEEDAPEISAEETDEEPPHALHDLFANLLPAYSIALDRRSAGRGDEVTASRALVIRAVEANAPPMLEATRNLLDSAEEYSNRESDDSHDWTRHLVVFHDALAATEAPFYLDARLRMNRRTGRQRLMLSTYDLHQRRTFAAGEYSVDALELARLDHVNHESSQLGYTRPEIRYALVRADRVEGFLIDVVMPSIHSGSESVIVRGYEDEADASWVSAFEQWAHEDLRGDAARVFRDDEAARAAILEVAEAIVARGLAVEALNRSLRSVRVELREPDAYRYDAGDLSHLQRHLDPHALRELQLAEARLRRADARDVWARFKEAIVVSVMRHEVQHRLDYEDDRLVAVPAMLAAYTGETESEDRVNHRAERSNAELSAYLSQIAQTPELSLSSLIHIASFAMKRQQWGRVESYTSLVVFESLAAAAGVEHEPLVSGRRVNRAEIARIYGALRAKSESELAQLASSAWAALYGAELRSIE